MDEKRNGCEVCFHEFDNHVRRPKVVPCGHTFCSKCVSDNFKENLLFCPLCRQEHHATAAADFPVNFKLESFLFQGIPYTSTPSEIINPTPDQPKGISKKLKSITRELSCGMEIKATSNKEVRSQLHQYLTLVAERKLIHHQIRENHMAIVLENDDLIQIMEKESTRIAEALKEEEKETQRMKTLNDKLQEATTAQEVFLSMEDATHCYDVLDRWNQEAKENFPNIQLLTKSVLLVEQSQALLQTLTASEGEAAATATPEPPDLTENLSSLLLPSIETSSDSAFENESSPESSLLNPKPSIQEKVTRALENASVPKQVRNSVKDMQEKAVQTETDAALISHISEEAQTELCPLFTTETLRKKTAQTLEIIEQGKGFALQELEDRRRYAQISVDQKNRICLHYLKEQTIPSNAHILKHSDVLKLIDVSSRLVFLELYSNEKKKTLGKLYIRLSPDTKRAQQFALLCSGEKEASYVTSNILDVYDKGNINEFVLGGDYENLGGEGGRPLVPDVLKEKGGVFKRPWVAGTIIGSWSERGEARAAQFWIFTRDRPEVEHDWCFGMVEEGLAILREAIDSHSDITKVVISDAGIVLNI